MKYRIKMIQKYSGENLFIPQYLNPNWFMLLVIKIFGSPIMFLFWLFLKDEKRISEMGGYFHIWNNIHYDKTTFKEIHTLFHFNSCSCICDSKADAEMVIKYHRVSEEERMRKEKDKRQEKEADRTKKILYIKIK